MRRARYRESFREERMEGKSEGGEEKDAETIRVRERCGLSSFFRLVSRLVDKIGRAHV